MPVTREEFANLTGENAFSLRRATELAELVYEGMRNIYGDTRDMKIIRRVERELYLSELFNMAHQLLALSDLSFDLKERNIPYFLVGGSASSLLLFLLGVSFANPLPPHYICPNCKSLIWDDSRKSGFDLPKRVCECGRGYNGDGHNLPYEVFWGDDMDVNRFLERKDIVSLVLPYDAHQYVFEYMLGHPLMHQYALTFPPEDGLFRLIKGQITINFSTKLPPENPSWFETLPQPQMNQAVLERLRSMEELRPVYDFGFTPDSFSESIASLGLYYCGLLPDDALWLRERPSGLAIEEVPLYVDDVFHYYADFVTGGDALWKAKEAIYVSRYTRHVSDFLFDALERYSPEFPKAHAVEQLIALAKGAPEFSTILA
jgi:hypothetical protein